tara:strand:+ start:680 stop:1525 length:846 start_codon:yes stop_codon:yes gene_type:complete
MAVGLIKKQIIHSSGSKGSPVKFLGGLFGGKGNKRKLKSAEADYQKEMGAYRNMEFKNPFSENIYSNMENTMEDLTINQQQAEFQSQQSQQSQANILQSLQSSGNFNAGNIQALANQGTIAAQQASASIGQQESRNQGLQAQEASRLQTMDRQGRGQVQSGEAALQQMNSDRQATMLGMSMQQVGNAQQAIAANKAMWGNIIGAVGSAAVMSDRRLKKNINKIGKSPSGLNVYSFEYKNSLRGKGLFQGVMSDEIPQEAVGNINGYDHVNYDMLDVEFKQI